VLRSLSRRTLLPAAAAGTALLALTGARVPVSAQDAAPGGTNLEGLEREVRAILARCDSAVVRVEGERVARFGVVARTVEARLALEERLRAFGPRESVSAAGFLAEEEGLVLTTSAASTGAGAIRVTFPGGTVREGKLLGEDLLAGVALVRVDPVEGTRALRLSAAEPGRGAVSLLLAPRGEEPPTIHLGFVTATGRPFGNYDGWLVSSVPLTAGHAGAPLLDARGEVMGMAVAPRVSVTYRTLTPAPDPGPSTPEEVASEGPNLGRLLERSMTVAREAPFATFVPAGELRRIAADLRTLGRVRRGMLGVRMNHGEAVLREVPAGYPAAKAGVVPGERIVALDGNPVESSDQVTGFVQRRAPGTRVRLRLRAGGDSVAEREVEVVLAELPPSPAAAPQYFDGIAVAARDAYDLAAAKFQTAPVPGADFVVVASVAPGSPADRAGLRAGDWILEIAGGPLLSVKDFETAVKAAPVDGGGVEILVYSAGEAQRRRLLLK